MKLLSIDVGIKNLALCLFEVINDKCNILNWDVVNLCNEVTINCECGKKAGYTYNKDNNDVYCCKKHIISGGKKLIPKEIEINKLKKMKINELRAILTENNFEYDNKKSKVLLLEYISPLIKEKYAIPFSNKVRTTDLSLIEIGINLKYKLDELYKKSDNKIDIDCVIIENQISPIANRMKTLQGMLAQYFIMNHIHNIQFISASNKLKEYTESKNTTYNERKHKGIEICEEIIINSEEFSKHLDIFTNSKKKDDLADCFLQGLWYLKDKSYIQ